MNKINYDYYGRKLDERWWARECRRASWREVAGHPRLEAAWRLDRACRADRAAEARSAGGADSDCFLVTLVVGLFSLLFLALRALWRWGMTRT